MIYAFQTVCLILRRIATQRSSNSIVHANDTDDDDCQDEVSPFRRVLPQFLACLAKNLLLFDLGLAVSFPTIVIPVLRGLQADRNPDEFLAFTDEQSSWYGECGVGRSYGGVTFRVVRFSQNTKSDFFCDIETNYK